MNQPFFPVAAFSLAIVGSISSGAVSDVPTVPEPETLIAPTGAKSEESATPGAVSSDSPPDADIGRLQGIADDLTRRLDEAFEKLLRAQTDPEQVKRLHLSQRHWRIHRENECDFRAWTPGAHPPGTAPVRDFAYMRRYFEGFNALSSDRLADLEKQLPPAVAPAAPALPASPADALSQKAGEES